MLSLKRLVVISRPITYLAALTVYGAGLLAARAQPSWQAAVGALFFTFPMGIIVYGINDIADRESDALNPRKGGLYGAVLQRSETRGLAWFITATMILSVAALALSGLYACLLPLIYIYMFAYFYSVRPLRLKARPVIDSLSNGLWIGAIFLTGYLVTAGSAHIAIPVRLTAAVVVCATAYHALTTIPDYEVDKRSGDHTIAVIFGRTTTLLFSSAAFAVSYYLVGRSHFSIGLYLAACTVLPLTALRFHSPKLIRQICLAILFLLPAAIAPVIF